MSRLPFDPDRLPPADAGKPARRENARYGSLKTDRPLTVSQTADLIKRVLADRTPSPVRVIGEISNFSERQHWYLSLRDDANVLNCVMWASAARKCDFTPRDGQEVVAAGRLDYYGPQGRLQLYIDRLEPVGQGALEQRFRELCDELRQLGFFDEDAKQPLPPFPQRIAVVTSESGAALQDVIRTTKQRWAGCQLLLADVRVQGEGAAEQIARTMRALSAQQKALAIDAIILTRGGGSIEDLWQFNERVVAEAVFECGIPIVAAIGHESDTTIAELVADVRSSTPTQAAMHLVPDASEEQERIDHLAHRLALLSRRAWDQAKARYEMASRFAAFSRPELLTEQHRHEMERLTRGLTDAMSTMIRSRDDAWTALDRRWFSVHPRIRLSEARRRVAQADSDLLRSQRSALAEQRARVEAMSRELDAVGPRSVLRRGYSITRLPDGRTVRSTGDVAAGQRLVTGVIDGQITSRVEAAEPDQPDPAPKPTRKAKPPGPDGKSQLDLF